MRIYAVADVHGKADKINRIRKNIDELKPEVLVVAGDITNFKNSAAIIETFNRMPVPVLAVRGNTDAPRVEHWLDRYPNTTSLHLKKYRLKDTCFVGVSGTIPLPLRSRIGVCERKTIAKLTELVDEDSVLVAHPPPWGTLDEVFGRFHAGCRRLHRLVIDRRPKLLLCGHIHEKPGVASIGNTRVVNCCMARAGNGALVNFDSGSAITIEMI
jgi:Icc-related predicted phosphoesterase